MVGAGPSDGAGARAGGPRAPRRPPTRSGGRSTLDLLEPGLTLFAAGDEPAWDSAAASFATRVPVAVRRLEPIAARAVGAPAGAALLARSDGIPVGVLPAGADPLPSLRAAEYHPTPTRPRG